MVMNKQLISDYVALARVNAHTAIVYRRLGAPGEAMTAAKLSTHYMRCARMLKKESMQ